MKRFLALTLLLLAFSPETHADEQQKLDDMRILSGLRAGDETVVALGRGMDSYRLLFANQDTLRITNDDSEYRKAEETGAAWRLRTGTEVRIIQRANYLYNKANFKVRVLNGAVKDKVGWVDHHSIKYAVNLDRHRCSPRGKMVKCN